MSYTVLDLTVNNLSTPHQFTNKDMHVHNCIAIFTAKNRS